jgi:predicted MPP superfamily phosphohydrolase
MYIFFIVFLSIYGLANYYILHRSLQALPFLPLPAKIAVWALFIFGTFSYILSKTLFSKLNNFLYDAVLWFGSVWFAVVLYSFLICLLIDFLRLIRFTVIAISRQQMQIPVPAGWVVFAVAFFIVVGIVSYGCYNFRNIKVKELSFEMSNPEKAGKDLRILFFSDAHLTSINNGSLMNKVIGIMNARKPDIILMGGDILDDNAAQLDRHHIGEHLAQLKAPLGVFTCPGNHEYINGYNQVISYLEQHGITILRDSSVNIGGFITVIGRDDPSGFRLRGERRKSIPELMQAAQNSQLPVVLLDHQPFHLEQAEEAGVALQLSGHTHHGQLFPMNLITKSIYELSWGYLKKGMTHFYVSSGIGGWGPPVRTGSDAEAIIINLHFTK